MMHTIFSNDMMIKFIRKKSIGQNLKWSYGTISNLVAKLSNPLF